MTTPLHLDIDTLLASETLICVMFAIVLYIMAQRFGDLHGPRRLAQAFIASGIGTFLFLMSGFMPLVASVFFANAALLLANLLFYDGVDHLLQRKPRLVYPASIAAVALVLLCWFTAESNRIDVRIILLSVTDCLMQGWLLVDLLRSESKRLPVKLLAISVMLSMLTDLLRGLAVLVSGSSSGFLHHPLMQAAYMFTGVLAACGLGIFSLMLVTTEIMESVERSARRDSLTGVLNRRGIEELLKTELDRASRAEVPLSLALIDIDEFKTINDTWGHPVGDTILCDVSKSITSNLRSYDACGRIGGDEFMVILPGSNASGSSVICERILHQVSGLPPHRKGAMSPSVSIGFTEYHSSDSPESIVARADRALYAAKREGRNRIHQDLKSIYALREIHVVPPASMRRPALLGEGPEAHTVHG